MSEEDGSEDEDRQRGRKTLRDRRNHGFQLALSLVFRGLLVPPRPLVLCPWNSCLRKLMHHQVLVPPGACTHWLLSVECLLSPATALFLKSGSNLRIPGMPAY